MAYCLLGGMQLPEPIFSIETVYKIQGIKITGVTPRNDEFI